MTTLFEWLTDHWHDATTKLWHSLHNSKTEIDTIKTQRMLDLMLFLTPLSAIANVDLVVLYNSVYCVDGGFIVDQIYALCFIVHASFAFAVCLLWNYFWTVEGGQQGVNSLYERFLVNYALQVSRIVTSIVLLLLMTISPRVSDTAVVFRFYVLLFLCLDIVSSVRTVIMSYRVNDFLRNLVGSDNWSTALNSSKIVTLILLHLFLYKHENVDQWDVNVFIFVLIVLCGAGMLYKGNCWDIFRYKQLFLVAFSVFALYLTFFVVILRVATCGDSGTTRYANKTLVFYQRW